MFRPSLSPHSGHVEAKVRKYTVVCKNGARFSSLQLFDIFNTNLSQAKRQDNNVPIP
jgi:hypothetical protein